MIFIAQCECMWRCLSNKEERTTLGHTHTSNKGVENCILITLMQSFYSKILRINISTPSAEYFKSNECAAFPVRAGAV